MCFFVFALVVLVPVGIGLAVFGRKNEVFVVMAWVVALFAATYLGTIGLGYGVGFIHRLIFGEDYF